MTTQQISADYFSNQPLRMEVTQGSADSDTAIAQTIERMARAIKEAEKSPIVRDAASHLVRVGDRRAIAGQVFWFCKLNILFAPDDPVLAQVFSLTAAQDLLIEPPLLLSMSPMRGDCDDFSMTAAALLRLLGCPAELVTIAANPASPHEFTHVFLQVILEDGKRLPFDCSHGEYLGWEAPRQFRRQVWSIQTGEPV